jgi:hypothetical protein
VRASKFVPGLENALATAISSILLVLTFLLCSSVAIAARETQDFETWPTTGSWGTTMHEGWTLSDGQVKPNRGGFAPPIDTRSGFLHDFDDSTNSWIQSPLFAPGVLSVSVWTRPDVTSGGTNFAVIQTSGDGVNWADFETFTIASSDWEQKMFAVDTFGSTFVRILKTGDTAINSYAGIDDIDVTARPAVFLSNLTNSMGIPALPQNIDVFADALIHPTGSNVVISAFYRHDPNAAFTEILMALDAGMTYRTTSQIPFGPGHDSDVEYYVQAAFDEGEPSLVFLPSGGSNAPAMYSTLTRFGNTAMRQLSPSSERSPLIISEIMYHPADSPDTNSMEFIEIFNTEPVDQDIGGFRISGNVDYTFSPGTKITYRSYILVARNPDAVEQAYGLQNVFGPYTNNLPNNGGTVRLRNQLGGVIQEVNYDDELPWPIAADGSGHSLQLAKPDYGEGSVRAWQASAHVGGSPGTFDPLPDSPLRSVVINEFLAHTDLPDTDYIELYNRGTQAVDISDCGLSDTLVTNEFFIPPATILQPGDHIVFDQATLGFSLRSGGDEIYLWAPGLSNMLDAVRFDAQANGVPTGRFPDGASRFHALDAQTPGTANMNAELLTHDVVINEIMYAPLSNNTRDEYVELYNRGTNEVDLSYWRFVDGIDYLFPAGTEIPAGGYLVIAADAQHLLTNYAQLNSANTLGDFTGVLSDREERIALAKPDDPALPFEDLVIVDEVTYDDGEHWGKWADRGGSSLELIDPWSDNRLAMNWTGSDESAKSSWISIERTGALEQGSMELDHSEQFDIFIPYAGEWLVDDIEVIREGETNNRVTNPGFDSGLANWTPGGTHVLSAHEAGEGFTTPGSLRVRASGRGFVEPDTGILFHDEVNHVKTPLTMDAQPDEVFTLRAKAKWVAGWPVCVFGFGGHWLEAASPVYVLLNLGSPGLENSRFATNVGPAIHALTHYPILPKSGESVNATCRVHDPDGVASLELEYRIDPSTTYNVVPMKDDGTGGDVLAGDGVFTGKIPGQSSGVIAAFHVKALDNHANPQMTYFPSADSAKDALVRFGESEPSGLFGSYIVWMSAANANLFSAFPRKSDFMHDITFVYENHRVIYNAGIRARGNVSRGFADYRDAVYACELPKSDRFLGSNEFKIDEPMLKFPDQSPSYVIQEYHAFWLSRQVDVAAPRMRFVRMRVNGSELFRQHYQPPTRDFCQSWYGDNDPVVHKSAIFDPLLDYERSDGLKAKAKYRVCGLKKKTSKPTDSYQTLYNFSAALASTGNATIVARVAAIIDPYEWPCYYAVNRLTGNTDTPNFGVVRNQYVYLSSTHPSRLHLHDMDSSYAPGGMQGGLFPGGTSGSAIYGAHSYFRRAYWRLLKALMQGSFAKDVYEPELLGWFSVFQANGIDAAHPQDIMNWNAVTRNRIANALPPASYAISGSDFNTTDNIATLSGPAPIDAATFRINGREQRMTYPSDTNWSTCLGLDDGPNVLVVEGVDRDGNIVGSDSVTVTLTTAAPSPVDQLIISEIMYHPDDMQAEYVEIFNRSSDTFDLGGWRLNGVDVVFDGGALIGPGEYRVAAENITAYQHTYGNAEVAIGDYGGNLDNGGETLTLEMPIGSNAWMEIDKVRYDNGGVWPTAADGTGASLQRIDLNADNSRAGNWGVVSSPESAGHTPGFANSNAMTLFNFPLLWINEVMPSNVSVNIDNFGEFEPWIELYNADAVAHDLSGYRLSDDYSDLERWAFPTGTTIAAGSRLLVWADGETNETDVGFLHADFRLNSTNGSVILTRQWLGSPVVIDYLDYNTIGEDASFGSFPEGDAFSRLVFPVPSPGTANSPTSPPVQVVINEWMSDNETIITDPSDGNSEDWFELYNPSTVDANLNGYTLTDDLSMTNMFTIPPGITVPAGKFLFVWADNEPEQNGPGVGLHVNFRLSRDGDAIGLYAPSGMLVDSVVFGPQEPDQSFGHWPDGAPVTYTMSPPTPAASNSVYVAFMVDVSASTSEVFQVDATTNLLGTNWILFDIFTAVNGVVTFTDSNAAAIPARFYRLTED